MPVNGRSAVVLPVYNEGGSVGGVLDAVRLVFGGLVIVVDDGSTDDTVGVLALRDDIIWIRHGANLGYGRSLIDGFAVALSSGVTEVLTMDCDGQHEPAHIPAFIDTLRQGYDIVSGSRYLPASPTLGMAPEERRAVNQRVTAEVNRVTGWGLTDAFCGFKAYRASALEALRLDEPGYGLPLQVWAQAYHAGLRVVELPVTRIYFDGDRSFGQDLDDADRRLGYYLDVWRRSLGEEM